MVLGPFDHVLTVSVEVTHDKLSDIRVLLLDVVDEHVQEGFVVLLIAWLTIVADNYQLL